MGGRRDGRVGGRSLNRWKKEGEGKCGELDRWKVDGKCRCEYTWTGGRRDGDGKVGVRS